MEECPSLSLTIFGCTSFVRRSVAQVCLRSWKRSSGSPARLSSGFQYLSCRVSRLKVTSHLRLLAALSVWLERDLHYSISI